MKRVIAYVVAIAALTVGVSVTGAQGTAPAAAGTLEFWSWNNEGSYPKVHEVAEKRFEAAFPDIDVKRTYIAYADYIPKLKAALAAGNPPDIAQIPWAGEFRDVVSSGQLRSLTSDVRKGFPSFYATARKAVTLNGNVWAVPLDLNTLQIAYNKTLFAKHGIKPPKTTADLIAAAEKLSAENVFGIALGTKDKWAGGDTWFAQLAYSDASHSKLGRADAGKLSWRATSFKQAGDTVAQLVRTGVFAPGANSMDAFVGALDLFVAQRAAMMYPVGNFVTGGIAAKVGNRFKWSLFPFPPPRAGVKAVPTGGIAEMFTVTKAGDNQEAAVDFLRYLTDKKGRATLVANDFIPSAATAVPKGKSALYRNMVNAQANAQSRVIYSTRVYAALLDAMQKVFDGKGSGADVVKALDAASKKK